jgi:hypothetical protein
VVTTVCSERVQVSTRGLALHCEVVGLILIDHTAIFVGPYFGLLADRWGRRTVYSMVLVGLMLQLVSFYIVCTPPHLFPVPVKSECIVD